MRYRPSGAEVDSSSPQAWATCDRCGRIFNHFKLSWSHEWRGTRIENTRLLVCPTCLDIPQRQLGVNIIEPDPVSIRNARPEPLPQDVEPGSTRVTETGLHRIVSGYPWQAVRLRTVSTDFNVQAQPSPTPPPTPVTDENWVDDNGITTWIDDNGITSWTDDNGV